MTATLTLIGRFVSFWRPGVAFFCVAGGILQVFIYMRTGYSVSASLCTKFAPLKTVWILCYTFYFLCVAAMLHLYIIMFLLFCRTTTLARMAGKGVGVVVLFVSGTRAVFAARLLQSFDFGEPESADAEHPPEASCR